MKSESKIHLLEEHIIDQIKAGEVIERPSALIKEILENSIDANSTKIELNLVNNGLDLISITDNGSGISAQDLPLAFCRHATSKISRFDDLYRLNSYGFRGEALASIASISKVSCESKNLTSKGLIKIEGGETLTHQVDQNKTSETGTKIFIKDLFYNTPVRMKFIKSKTSEKNQIKKIVNAYLLTNPHISFQIKWDEQEKLFYDKVNFSNRIKDVLFRHSHIEFLHNENSYNNSHVNTYISKQSSRGNANKQCFIFINERFVQDIQLHKVILASAQALWPDGESGHYIVKISVPSDELDVNVHPNKTVIKLFKNSEIISLLSSTIKQIISREQIPKIVTGEEPQSFHFTDKQNVEPTNFNYREIDFKNPGQTQDYFNNIHNPYSNETLPYQSQNNIMRKFKSFAIISYHQKIFGLKLSDLIKLSITKILEASHKESDIAPLMVSRPFKLETSAKKECLQYLNKIGFELDQIEKTTYLLRSFPIKFQHLSYTKIVDFILTYNIYTNEQLFKKCSFDFLLEEKISDDFLLKELESFPITNLIEQKVLFEINEERLNKLYES